MTRRAWGRQRAVRAFVAAVTNGDIDLAEDSARHALSGNDRPAPKESNREHQPGWDEHVTVPSTWLEAATELREADGLARWCPTVRLIASGAEGETIAVGRFLPVRLRLLSRRWFAEGLRLRADTGGSVLVGHVTLRPSALGDGTQVWIHAEGPRCYRSRRALRAVRREARRGLKRWAAHRSASA